MRSLPLHGVATLFDHRSSMPIGDETSITRWPVRRVAWVARANTSVKSTTPDKVDPPSPNLTATKWFGKKRGEGRPPDREIVVIQKVDHGSTRSSKPTSRKNAT